ncbi:AraC family transcriptional regulator [Luteibacter sp.]|uniref:helix-turn-helix domain-containing protein n=1 Tax=Luteibacter sp. TaxID=1886636 RepID=UPI002D7F165A|nr:AraC family transcriptional regulator [Luteibacter sp.]
MPSPGDGDGDAPARAVLQLLNHALSQLADIERVDRAACARYIAQALHIHRQTLDPVSYRRAASGLAAWQVRIVHEIALAHLDAPLAITELATACRLSRGYFTRAFKVTFGDSPHRWRHRKRIEYACSRLKETSEVIAGIAIVCGFNDQAHFTRAFKTAMGMTPNAYRRNATSTGDR